MRCALSCLAPLQRSNRHPSVGAFRACSAHVNTHLTVLCTCRSFAGKGYSGQLSNDDFIYYSLPLLKKVDLSGNQISGPIPDNLSKLPSLTYLCALALYWHLDVLHLQRTHCCCQAEVHTPVISACIDLHEDHR